MGEKEHVRVAVIGCGDAGLSAAFAAARQGADVTIISDIERYYPRCPLPYYIAGQVRGSELVKPLEMLFKGTNIRPVFDTAVKIKDNQVICKYHKVDFDKAIIATGAHPKKTGDSMVLRTLEDADGIKKLSAGQKPVIVGGGVLGCELADVLGGTLIEEKESILPNFDPEFSDVVAKGLSKKAEIRTGTRSVPDTGFVISATGALPNLELAKKSGIKTSEFGVRVDSNLETSMPGVYAAGDCIEERCLITRQPMHSYLGPQSEREGVMAGTNAAGGAMVYEGSLNAVVAKIAGYEIGITGLSGHTAAERGMSTVFGRVRSKTKPDYDRSAADLTIKMLFDGDRLVGCQALGGESVEGVINLASYAMQHHATVEDLIGLAYCYSPPICSAPNPIILCAENAKRRMTR